MPPIVKIDSKDIADASKSAPWMTGQQKRDVQIARATAVAEVGVALLKGGQQAWAEHQLTRRAAITAATERHEVETWATERAGDRKERMALCNRLPDDQPEALLSALQMTVQAQIANGVDRPGRKRG